jgi:hypothetical protein
MNYIEKLRDYLKYEYRKYNNVDTSKLFTDIAIFINDNRQAGVCIHPYSEIVFSHIHQKNKCLLCNKFFETKI